MTPNVITVVGSAISILLFGFAVGLTLVPFYSESELQQNRLIAYGTSLLTGAIAVLSGVAL